MEDSSFHGSTYDRDRKGQFVSCVSFPTQESSFGAGVALNSEVMTLRTQMLQSTSSHHLNAFLVTAVLALVRPVASWVAPVLSSSFRAPENRVAKLRSLPAVPTNVHREPPMSDDSKMLTRAEWIRIGASLPLLVPLVTGLEPKGAEAAQGGVSTVTVLGAGGKTGRECVEYLAAHGSGKIVSIHKVHRYVIERVVHGSP